MNSNRVYDALVEIGGDALFLIDHNLRIRPPCSSSCQTFFQREIVDLALAEILDLDTSVKDALFFGIGQLFENIMDPSVVVSMLPNRINTLSACTHQQWFYSPVIDEQGAAVALIVSIRDITERVACEKANEVEIKRFRTLVNILQQGPIFNVFLEDTDKDFSHLTECSDMTLGKRLLHTLKGNFAAMGLTDISTAIHDMEHRLVTNHAGSNPGQLRGFYAQCALDIAQSLDRFLEDNFNELGVRRPATTNNGEPSEEKVDNPASSGEELVCNLVKSFYPQIAKLAERLNKKIRFVVEGGDTLIDENRIGPVIREMIHLIRNSCDHGIEKIPIRLEQGKNEEGTIRLEVRDSVANIQFIIVDDGGGIAVEKIRRKALASGIITQQQADLFTEAQTYDLIFCDGVSSAEQITSISGRGVGLAALKAEVERAGGLIEVTAKPNVGSTFTITVPKGNKHANAA